MTKQCRQLHSKSNITDLEVFCRALTIPYQRISIKKARIKPNTPPGQFSSVEPVLHLQADYTEGSPHVPSHITIPLNQTVVIQN